MTLRSELLGVVAAGRYSRQILGIGTGVQVASAAGATSLAVPYPTNAASVGANALTYLIVALKPGTANLGSVTTPSGWTKIADHIGGGYGATLGDATGNSRVYLFYKTAENTATGNLTVSFTPDGANGVAAACMGRLEKKSGTWQTIVSAKGEATVDNVTGSYTLTPDLSFATGDVWVYAWAMGANFPPTGNGFLTPGADLTGLAGMGEGVSTSNGYDVGVVGTAYRAQRTGSRGTFTFTLAAGGLNRGPVIVARFRVR